MHLELINAGRLITRPSWTKRAHKHPYHQFIVMLKGRLMVELDGVGFDAGRDDVLLYPAGALHHEQIDPAAPADFIYFGWNGEKTSSILIAKDARGKLRLLAEWIVWESQNSTYAQRQDILNAFLHAFLEEYRRCTAHTGSNLAEEIRTYIRRNIRNELTLDQLARHAGMNKFTFLRNYRRLTGSTPRSDICRIRAETARELITGTNATLAAIAEETGCSSEQQLSRLVHRVFGVPPGSFRK